MGLINLLSHQKPGRKAMVGNYSTVIVLLFLFLFTSGCSSSEPKSSFKDACEVITKSDAEAITGMSMQDAGKIAGDRVYDSSWGEEYDGHWMSDCLYRSKTLGAQNAVDPIKLKDEMALVSIMIKTIPDYDPETVYGKHLDELRSSEFVANNYSLKSISELGDAAGWDKNTNQLTVFNDGFYLLVSATNSHQSSLDLSKEVARLALKRLSRPTATHSGSQNK